MKHIQTAGLSFALTLALASGWALADLAGSKHDFRNKAWANGSLCSGCHGPDHAEPPKAAPLWNPGADLSRKFGSAISGQQPSISLATNLCLQCHDGTLANDAVAAAKVAKPMERFVNKSNAGMFAVGQQVKDHPVGIKYPQFDRNYQPRETVIAKGKVRLPESRVECISCHDPHNTSGQEYMLVMSNARSALCLSCHKK